MRHTLSRLLTLAATAFTCATLAATPAHAEDLIRVSGIPDENPTELSRKYQPMVDMLQKQLGVKVVYVPVIDYGAAVSALAAGKVDFAWLGGFTHVQAKVLAGAKPVVMRDIDREFQSVFIANTAAGIHKPEELRGKSFAFGSKSSTSGHLFPRHFLSTQFHIDADKDFAGAPLYSGAHDATVKMVESGKVQAGALNIEVWNRLLNGDKVDKAKVKVIWTTPPFVDYVWTARKDLPPATVQKFANAFLNLDANKPEDKAVLDLQGAKKFVVAKPEDFLVIEQVGRSTGLLK
ncbi:MAG: putative selenate ABC transporter substrate-binding protein [Aquabacterium sp.]|uniref:putative selenate ABC transporter substrate-binding protein n=1 Tax=Aquabacterium sp. TaxID=1872578 RepID=UPI001E009F4A|nr:putative selenate ABC transporter substrate-binding protein [Aquabacterium sp.]MBT9609090.1 putative selenate ABC transporter substrate-binding protein [Aquabacterium sp.]